MLKSQIVSCKERERSRERRQDALAIALIQRVLMKLFFGVGSIDRGCEERGKAKERFESNGCA